MKLVLAEKPSVAQSLAKVLGANKRCDGYLEGNGYIVSWCIGHLVELSPPEAYDETYAKWRLADLPILPAVWKYQVSSSTKKQFGILKKLMKRDDVESLVCATDAGREGELIFRLVYHQAGCKKPFERLWISSMEDQAIKEGFTNLEPSTKYDALYEAALCRERADWIVGMNATRLFSCLYHQTLNIGRVMTPTLAMVVMRDAEIAAFKPKPFYTVQLGLNGITAASRRFDEKGDAQQLLAKCKETMKAVIKSMDRKEKTERAPLLYDLTSLQRDANRILGFTAQQTLDYTQALYEKKLVTYPRTDSRYLTDGMKPMLPSLISQVAEKFGVDASLLKADDNTEIFVDVMCDSRKVSDHHAIIPTKTMCAADFSGLPSGEKSILQLIAVRLLCAAAPDHRYAEDAIVLTSGGEEFSKKIKTVLFGGWKDIWQRFYPVKDKEKEAYSGPPLSPDTIVSLSQAEIKEGKTTAPKRFTEDTLLSAMETAGAEDIPEDAERKGLGTPATRAGTIEKLVQKGFMERKGDRDICLFSASCMMNSIQFEITIEAQKDTTMWVISADTYSRLMKESAVVANFTNEVMATRFSEVMWLMEQIMWKSFDKRLAGFLLEECSLEGTNILKITHETIAGHMGTAREVVTRMLRYFQNESMVKLTRGTVEVTDKAALEELQNA